MMLRRHNIKPILVFDGRPLGVKKKTEDFRKNTKKENLEKAKSYLSQGDTKEARKFFSRAIKITKKMIYQTIDLLKHIKVDVILAPYEADAQIAFLIRNSYAHMAISEDSDLVSYGVPKILFKLGLSGDCQYLDLIKYKDSGTRMLLKDKLLRTFLKFNQDTVIFSCIMAGCDYLPSIKGIGIKKAVDYLERFGGDSDSVIKRLQFEKNFMGRIPVDYAKTVKKIALVFKYQRVFDPNMRKFTTLEGLPEDIDNPGNNLLIGEEFEDIESFANGDLDIKKLGKRELKKIELEEFFAGEIEKKIEKFDKREENNDKTIKKKEIFKGDEENEMFVEDWNEIEVNIVEVNEKKTEKKEKNNDFEVRFKINEEIDYLFEICKGFSEESKPISVINDLDIIENTIIPLKTEKIDKKYAIFQNSLEKTDKLVHKIENPIKTVQSSPSNPKTPLKINENPFAIAETSNKKDLLVLDSLTKLSTEKVLIDNKETTPLITKPFLNKLLPIIEEKRAIIWPSKRKDENKGGFEGNIVKKPEKKAKIIDNNRNQSKLMNFFTKI